MNSLPSKLSTHSRSLPDTIELMEFGDFTCSRCRGIRQLLDTVFSTFACQLTYTFCHFPNPLNESSVLAALAAEAARRQEYFWPMFRALFNQSNINHTNLSSLANSFGMNYNQFMNDLSDEQVRLRIEADQREGYRFGVTQTPTLLVGGQQFHGKFTQSRLNSIVRSQLSRRTRPILSKVDA